MTTMPLTAGKSFSSPDGRRHAGAIAFTSLRAALTIGLFLASAGTASAKSEPSSTPPPTLAPSQSPPAASEPAVKPMPSKPSESTAPPAPPKRPRGPIVVPPMQGGGSTGASGGMNGGLEPVRPNVPGTPATELGLGVTPPLMREGAFVSQARGQMVQGKSGRWFFVFDRDATGRTLPPMILQPCPNLVSMERLVETTAGSPAQASARLRITGQVHVYRGRNYLLVTAPPLLERGLPVSEPLPSPPAPAPQSASAPAGPSSAAPGDPSIEQIIADLDRAVGPRETAGQRRPIAAPPEFEDNQQPKLGDPAGAAQRTTGYLAARRGRLVRAADGSLLFRTNAGPAGRTEPVLYVLPSQNLMNLEDIADNAGEGGAGTGAALGGITLTVSGDVMVYKGKSYLLPTMYMINRPSDNILPTQ